MTTKPAFCALALTALLAAGCSSTPSWQKDDSTIAYDAGKSRAKNLADHFGLEDLRDAKVADGTKIPSDGSLVWDTAAWAGNFYSAAGSGILPGTGNLGAALGWGLGISLISGLFGPTPKAQTNLAFGYVPLQLADTPVAARNLFVKQWIEALAAAVKDVYPQAAAVPDYAEFKDKWWLPDSYAGAVSIIDEKMGCLSYRAPDGDVRDWDDRCEASILAFTPAEWVTGTPSVLGPRVDAWRITGPRIRTVGGQDQKIDWVRLFAATAKHLPPYMMVYLTAWKNPDGVKTPPMVVEKDRINFFIRPAQQPDAAGRQQTAGLKKHQGTAPIKENRPLHHGGF